MSKNVLDKPSAEGKSRSVCTMPRRENVSFEETNVFGKPSAEDKSRSISTMPRRENDYYEETNSCLCRVSAAALPCVFLRLRKRSQSGGRAKAERRQNEGTLGRREPKSRSPLRHRNNSQDCCFTSRPFSNAKIVRNNDMANFFKQKMSLFPLLEKRGSLRGQKRLSFATGKEVPRVTKRGFSQLSWANCGLLARGALVRNSKVCKLRNIIRFPRCFFL